MERIQAKANYLGARGWVCGGRYGIERSLYLVHRITGLGLVLYGLLHLVVMTVFRMQGRDVFEGIMSFFQSPVFKIGEFLVFVAFIIHGINGIRLILQELGFALGRPTPPIYPYTNALQRKRRLTVLMIVLIILFSVFGLLGFLLRAG